MGQKNICAEIIVLLALNQEGRKNQQHWFNFLLALHVLIMDGLTGMLFA